jgi:hypothetical protein
MRVVGALGSLEREVESSERGCTSKCMAKCSTSALLRRALEPLAPFSGGRVSSLFGRSQSNTTGLFGLLFRNASNESTFATDLNSSEVNYIRHVRRTRSRGMTSISREEVLV